MTISSPDSDLPTEFTLEGYAALVDQFLARGYEIRGYADALPDRPHLILRHDLDMSIQAGRTVAECEAARGVAAHYFVLLRTDMYNPWSARSRADLRAIAEAGHKIGLHLDASLYTDELDALDDACATECDALEQILGRSVTMVSLHRPRARLLGLKRSLGGRPHSYQPRYFNEIGYSSDSRGAWHHGHPLDNPAVAENRALQLLTHPIWWTGDGPGPQRRLDAFVRENTARLRTDLAEQTDVYKSIQASMGATA